MDNNIIAASKHFAAQESDAQAACNRAADKHGGLHIADQCDDGENSCPRCPWKNTLSKWVPVQNIGLHKDVSNT